MWTEILQSLAIIIIGISGILSLSTISKRLQLLANHQEYDAKDIAKLEERMNNLEKPNTPEFH